MTISVASRAVVQSKLLWVGIEPQNRWADLRLVLSDADLHYAPELDSALAKLKRFRFDAAILSVKGLLDENLRKLERILTVAPSVPVIVCGWDFSAEDTIRFTRRGAFHAVGSDPDVDELRSAIARAVSRVSNEIPHQTEIPSWRRFLIGQSPAITQLCEIVQIIAARKVSFDQR